MFQPSPEPEYADNPTSGIFIPKMGNKQTIQGVFAGTAYYFWNNFNAKDKIPYEGCPKRPDGYSFRFRINLIVKENGAWTAKIWENSGTVNNQLLDLKKTYKKFLEMIFTITRNGTTKDDTRYAILPLVDEPLTESDKKQIAAVKLHDLKHKEDTSFEPANW